MINKKLIYVFLFTILLVSPIYAWEFDNVKNYDSSKKEVTVKNIFGLGGDIAKIRLTSPLNVVVGAGYQKVAEFEVNLSSDYNSPLEKIEFYNLKNKKATLTREFDYRYKDIETYNVPVYQNKCSVAKNGSDVCTSQRIGTEQKERVVWLPLEKSDFKKDDVLTIGIFTNVEIGDHVEWIPTFFGVRIDEWATWTESLNTNIVTYYTFNESSGTTAFESVNQELNLSSMSGSNWGAGLIGNAYYGNTTGENAAKSAGYGFDSLGIPITINYWINKTSIAPTQSIILSNPQAGAGRFRMFEAESSGSYRTLLQIAGDGDNVNLYGINLSANASEWIMMTYIINSTTLQLYINGEFYNSTDKDINGATYTYTPSSDAVSYFYFAGIGGLQNAGIDEFGIWNRTLNDSEITQLYNGGAGITYTTSFTTLAVNQISPANDTTFTVRDINFSCNATDDNYNIDSIQLFIDGVGNYTESGGSALNLTLNHTVNNIEGGSHVWSCFATNNNSDELDSGNRTFNIDINPTVVLLTPENNSNFTSTLINFSLNATGKDGVENIENVSFWVSGQTIYSNNSGFNGYYNYTIGLEDGNWTWYAIVTSTNGGLNQTEPFYFDIDSKAPLINITSPNGTFASLNVGQNFSLRWTLEEANNVTSGFYNYPALNKYKSNSSVNTNIGGITTPNGFNFTDEYATNVSSNADIYKSTFGAPEFLNFWRLNGGAQISNWSQTIPDCYDVTYYSTSVTVETNVSNYYCVNSSEGEIFLIYLQDSTPTFNYTNALNSVPIDNTTLEANSTIQIPYESGKTSVSIVAFDNYGNIGFNKTSFSVASSTSNETYNSSTYETKKENFAINITYDNETYSSLSANLIYNGTTYIGTKSGTGTEVMFSREIDVPVISTAQENVSFYWDITVSNSTSSYNSQTSSNNQSINELIYVLCNATYASPVFVNFTIKDEDTLSPLNAEMDAAFRYSLGGDLFENYSLDSAAASTDSYSFCTNKNDTFITNSIIGLSASNYNDRTYTIPNTNYSNVSTTLTDLFLENSSLSSDIIIQVVNQGLQPLQGYYVDIERYYSSNDSYEEVIKAQTDEFGQFVADLIQNTVKYRFTFKDTSNKQVKQTDKVTIACRTTICVMQFVIEDTTDDFEDYNNITNFDSTLSFDDINNIFSVNWIDATGDTATYRLLVQKISFNGTSTVCNTSSVLATASINCTLSSSTSKESYRAQFYRQVAGEIEKRVSLLNVTINDLAGSVFGKEGLIWVMLLLFTLVGVGSFNPTVGAILYLVGFIGMGLIGIISMSLPVFFANIVIVGVFIWAFRG